MTSIRTQRLSGKRQKEGDNPRFARCLVALDAPRSEMGTAPDAFRTDSPPFRSGHSLIELVAAMICGTILLGGLAAVMFIARQTAYTPTASVRRIDAAQVIHELADELRYATRIIEQSAHVVDFVVADRSGDGSAERIRYEWSGTPGDPLYRTLNGGNAVELALSVQDFQCILDSEESITTYTTTSDTVEAVLQQSNTSVQDGVDWPITPSDHLSQAIKPNEFDAPAPQDAIGWSATRLEFFGRQSGSQAERLLIQIRAAGTPYGWPTSQVLGQTSIIESPSSSMAWNEVVFPAPVRGLSLERQYAIVWARNVSGGTAELRLSQGASGSVSETNDSGASWQFLPDREVYYKLHGTYTVPGPSYDVTRTYVSHLEVMLQTAEARHSRVETKIPLRNRPELLSAYWRADFDADPTMIDIDGDGIADWVMADGGSFDPDTLADGVWQASGALETRPRNDFTGVTTIDFRCRNTSVGGNGAVVRVHGGWQDGLHGPVLVRLQLQSDGTQTLTLLGKPSDAATTTLFTHQGLPDDFVRVRLTMLPEDGVVNLHINGEDQGAFSYPTYAPSGNDGFLTLYADGSDAEFDYAEVRVAN